MRFNVMTEPQMGATYDQLVAVAQRAEQVGFDGFFRSDHYTNLGSDENPGATDAWATLAGLARETKTVRLGSLMSPITWRHPVVLAKTVATVDEMSGGRVELGIGTGWQPFEHLQYGFPFDDFGKRFRWLEEALEIIIGLWTQDRTTYEGTRFSVTDADFVRKPVQTPHPPILVGGAGTQKTPDIAARYAQEWNSAPCEPEIYGQRVNAVVEACERRERDPKLLTYSVMLGVLVGSTQLDFEQRAETTCQLLTGDSNFKPFVDSVRNHWIVGTPEEAAERIGEYEAAGCQRMMLQFFDLDDLDHLDVVQREVQPRLS